MSKAEKRAAAKAAAARIAAAKKRRQSLLGALAGLAVIVLLIGAFLLFGRGSGKSDTAANPPLPPAPTEPTAPAAASFPPLPPGADPALATKPTVTAGKGELTKLTVTSVIAGKGPAINKGQQVLVNYVGVFYKTGQEFDASWKQSQAVPFQIGTGNVIPGWDQGLIGVKVGSRVQLDIPPKLAYGDKPTGGRPAGPLRFVVDVLAVQ
jgi:peptidylprolyl isomerase